MRNSQQRPECTSRGNENINETAAAAAAAAAAGENVPGSVLLATSLLVAGFG